MPILPILGKRNLELVVVRRDIRYLVPNLRGLGLRLRTDRNLGWLVMLISMFFRIRGRLLRRGGNRLVRFL